MIAALLLATALGAPRPRIGVALGGGGARGAAHVAILRQLEAQHIPVDYIAGTSMGAVVGGLYASGMTPDEIERALTTIDWRDALNDRTRYKDLAYRRKEDDNRYLTALEAGLRGGHIALPSGLRSGQKLRFLLQSYLVPVAGVHDFSKLSVPFKAVAADIETGEAVVLDHGDLAQSIRASMSIPGVFSPVEIDGHMLVDGGVADNVPVDVVRAMGADVVIAVDVGSPLLKREQLGSYLAVTGQVLTILTRQNAQKQLANADVVLAPAVSEFATMDFERVKEIIDRGDAYAREQAPRLASYVAEEVTNRPLPDRGDRTIDYVEVEGSRRVDDRVVKSHISTRSGDMFDSERLRRDVTRLYGLDDFQEVTFSLRDDAGKRGLLLNLKDKPWGPTYLRFGINVNDDLRGESSYNVVASATKTRLNALGAELRTDVRLGHDFGVTSELYQPLDFRGRFFVAPTVQFVRNSFALYENEERIALFNVDQRGAGVDLGMQFDDWGALRGGVYRGRVHAQLGTGDVGFPSGALDVGGLHGALTIVRTDSPTIPHQGSVISVQYTGSRRSLGARDEYAKLNASAAGVVSRGRQSFFLGGSGGTSLGTEIPVYDQFALGGLMNLSGFAYGQLHGNRYALLRAGTYTRLRTLPPEIGSGFYAGAFFEAGRVDDDDIRRSLTIIGGADTILGPVLLGYARTNTGDGRFYVTIGKTF